MKWFLSIVAGLIAALAFLVAANLDRISEFKASKAGIEAKTREVVARAETAVEELRILAEQLGQLSLSLVKRQGRIGGYSDDEQESVKASILDTMRKVGVPESTFPAVLKDWHRFTEFDYAHYILGGNLVPQGAEPKVTEEWKQLRRHGISNLPVPAEVREFLAKHGYLAPKVEELLQDYEHYRKQRTHRRPAVWRDRQNWHVTSGKA
ncbi:hypothetical protein J2X19_002475 [Rhodoferax ferrireducens]|uniref:Uncharacterized protein n=1 Tax=Rhodoferax ferrireducens TaxID=192843 RepID=A0ABU2C8Y4_9BURK|nr:hypothetical protein [Rhodoferax ferrireducens]MDR7377796.1 hypothetical protein [Rhodoferax ferrireducens]